MLFKISRQKNCHKKAQKTQRNTRRELHPILFAFFRGNCFCLRGRRPPRGSGRWPAYIMLGSRRTRETLRTIRGKSTTRVRGELASINLTAGEDLALEAARRPEFSRWVSTVAERRRQMGKS